MKCLGCQPDGPKAASAITSHGFRPHPRTTWAPYGGLTQPNFLAFPAADAIHHSGQTVMRVELNSRASKSQYSKSGRWKNCRKMSLSGGASRAAAALGFSPSAASRSTHSLPQLLTRNPSNSNHSTAICERVTHLVSDFFHILPRIHFSPTQSTCRSGRNLTDCFRTDNLESAKIEKLFHRRTLE